MSTRSGVIWDFDGTLAERPGRWAGCLLETLDAVHPGHPHTREEIAAQLRDGFPWHRPDVPHLELSTPDAWWGSVGDLLTSACLSLGYDQDRASLLASRMRERYVDGRHGWRCYDDTHEALDLLDSAGVRQVILSNHVPELPAIVRALGLSRYFETVISSASIGYEKPNFGAYAAALDFVADLDIAWMVGDNLEADCLGPERYGIRGVYLVRARTPAAARAPRTARTLVDAARLVLGVDERRSLVSNSTAAG